MRTRPPARKRHATRPTTKRPSSTRKPLSAAWTGKPSRATLTASRALTNDIQQLLTQFHSHAMAHRAQLGITAALVRLAKTRGVIVDAPIGTVLRELAVIAPRDVKQIAQMSRLVLRLFREHEEEK